MDFHYEGGTTGHIILQNVEFHRLYDNGFFNPVKWAKYLELTRKTVIGSINRAPFGKRKPFPGPITFFLVRQQIEFHPEILTFYANIQSNRSNCVANPVKFIHTTERINRSSAVYLTKVEDHANNVLLATAVSHLVLVDPSTRRPQPYPLEIKEFVQQNSKPENSLALVKPVNQPLKSPPGGDTQVHRWERTITLMDIDLNEHTNNSIYFALTLECLGDAISKGFPLLGEKDLLNSVIKKYSLIVEKESTLGQTITVKMWKTGNHFNFVLYVLGNRVSCSHIEFFD